MVNIQRPTFFFGQYQWCARFYLPECNALRKLDHRWIDRSIAQRRRWGRRLVDRPVGSWQGVWASLEITQQMEENLHVICDFLLSDCAPRRIRIQQDDLLVYSNDQTLFDRINALKICKLRDVKQVLLVGTPGAVNLKTSDYALRTYLRASRLDAHAAGSLRAFLQAQQDIKLSPSLLSWCRHGWLWTQRHFFFDHADEGTVNMLELIVPGLAKCTLPITTDK